MNNKQEKTVLLEEQKRLLKKFAHHLKPVVQIGKKGVSLTLIKEINQALFDHELIKIQILPIQKNEIEENIREIIKETNAHHIATIGNVIVLFKAREENSSFFTEERKG
ncbi:MAG: ribosome assembly RNA-binding protein YhbY [Myxococcales bacterium]|nr:ribosome assembly RNA-binding protein YhbY [Myxococcales bacterium]USN51204.1 MAG: ribosome assembly RNA-binding protein YhbY [Myxococcales bacterium]